MYRARTLEIASRVSPLGLGADIITGFPGERDADHLDTVRLVEELPYTYVHVFPFSPRTGTEAARAARDGVPQRVSGERSRELRLLVAEKGARHRRSRVGGPAVVVVEGDARGGLTEDYLRVAVVPDRSADHAGDRRRPWRGTLVWRHGELAIDLTGPAPFN
jgi:threonylcarbamoyladenosine tRNA methylthiotransferase MtaB